MTSFETWVQEGHFRRFGVLVLLLVTALSFTAYFYMSERVEKYLVDSATNRARDYVDLIVATREWNSGHGGVWVRKGPDVATNPYLQSLEVTADATSSVGDLTLRNPSLMTKELGGILGAISGSIVRMVSLHPINPENTANAWERSVLISIERDTAGDGSLERSAVLDSGNETVVSYLRALPVDRSCLTCHGGAGYQVGDIRGGVSITLPFESTATAIRNAKLTLAGLAFAGLALIWAVVLLEIRSLTKRLKATTDDLEVRALTDGLTGLLNRSTIMQRLSIELSRAVRSSNPVGIMILDLDHFKEVNDTFGHAAGDEVLQRVASAMRSMVRDYDGVGRIGGEEFLVVAPNMDADLLHATAERVRAAVEDLDFGDIDSSLRTTVSIGTALSNPNIIEPTMKIVERADTALYRAKDAGRNRVAAG